MRPWSKAGILLFPISGDDIPTIVYKGYRITPRTFQLRSGRWTLDVLIVRDRGVRAFSAPETYPTEVAANAGCLELGKHIIDGTRRDSSVADLH
jgi:hypothetical protein